jgi:hypothetical protein
MAPVAPVGEAADYLKQRWLRDESLVARRMIEVFEE